MNEYADLEKFEQKLREIPAKTAGVKAVAQAVEAGSDHADAWNAGLRALRRRGKEWFAPEDVAALETIVALYDGITGGER